MEPTIRLILEKRFNDNKHHLPEHMVGAMQRYLFDKIEPGSFLTAVLCNDLREAISRADSINKYKLADTVTFCMMVLPIGAWGSEEKVNAWLGSDDAVDDTTEADL